MSNGRIDATSVEAIGPEPLHRVSGVKDVLVELVTWTDTDAVHRWKARSQIGETDRAWYEEVSYGLASLTATVTPWMQIAEPSGCDTWGIRAAADEAAVAAGYDPGAYDLVMAYFPFYGECNWAGLAEIGGRSTWINGFMDSRVTIHEIGHNFGLLHSSDYVCRDDSGNLVTLSSNCVVGNDYGDPFSAMGNGLDGVGHFAPSQKRYLGWMQGRVRRLTRDADVKLAPIESADATAPQGLRIVAPFATYWVDYRQPIGADSWMPPTVTDGVLVHIDSREHTQLLDMRTGDEFHEDAALPIDSTFTDPLGVTIRPHDGRAAGVRITVTGLGFGRARWSQYKLDPGHRGSNGSEHVIGPGNVSGLGRAWAQRYLHVTGFPVLARGTLFFQARDENDRIQDWSRVVGVSASTGVFRSYHRTVCNTPRWPLAVGRHSVLVPAGAGCEGSTPGKLWAIDMRNNGARWTLEPSGPIVVNRGVVYGPIPAGSGAASLRAVAAGTGRVMWSANTSVSWASVRRTVPSVGGDILYLSTGPDGAIVSHGRVYASNRVFAFHTSDGSPLWQARCRGGASGLCAFDAATGAAVWTLRADLRNGIGEPAVGGKTAFATCGEGLCAFDAATGALVWRTPPEIGCGTSAPRGCRPIVANGVVYAPSADGGIRAFAARNGSSLAQIQVGPSPTAILVDGTLYTTANRGFRAYRIPV